MDKHHYLHSGCLNRVVVKAQGLYFNFPAIEIALLEAEEVITVFSVKELKHAGLIQLIRYRINTTDNKLFSLKQNTSCYSNLSCKKIVPSTHVMR